MFPKLVGNYLPSGRDGALDQWRIVTRCDIQKHSNVSSTYLQAKAACCTRSPAHPGKSTGGSNLGGTVSDSGRGAAATQHPNELNAHIGSCSAV
jgi:hypothetical protein